MPNLGAFSAPVSRMHSPSKVLVVGGGIAGYCVLLHLAWEGVETVLYDAPDSNTSSRRAAGLVNPFIIKRYTLSWKGAEAFTYASGFYGRLETLTKTKLIDGYPIYRLLSHEAILKEWILEREKFASLAGFMGLPEPLNHKDGLKGGWRALIPKSFRLRTDAFFGALEGYLKNHVRHAVFEYNRLKPFGKYWTYEDDNYEAVIFCEGTAVAHNPFVGAPFLRPCKGQWLAVSNPGLAAGYLGKIFLLPDGKESILAGSTYEHHFSDGEPDDKALKYLLEAVTEMMHLAPAILSHKTGIRPVSSDRRPVVGPAPHQPGLYILNGLGSRGFLLAPFLASKLVRHIVHNEPLPEETLYKRFIGIR